MKIEIRIGVPAAGMDILREYEDEFWVSAAVEYQNKGDLDTYANA